MFILLVVSHLVIVGSQAMANIWLCMWSDAGCMPENWRHSLNGSHLVGNELAIYGGLGAVQGLQLVYSSTFLTTYYYIISVPVIRIMIVCTCLGKLISAAQSRQFTASATHKRCKS